MIKAEHLRDMVIVPTLRELAEFDRRMATQSAINLLLCTAAHESLCGHFLKQQGGPALGLYQMEPDTHDWLWDGYLNRKPRLSAILARWRAFDQDVNQLVWDLRYATAMARVRYWIETDPLPEKGDLVGLAEYWDDHYNCNDQHYSRDGFLDNVNQIKGALL